MGGCGLNYQIEKADNGWIVSWRNEQDDGEHMQHQMVFQLGDDDDVSRDPEKLMEFLLWVKEEICGYYHSKHKTRNVMVRMEEKDVKLQ